MAGLMSKLLKLKLFCKSESMHPVLFSESKQSTHSLNLTCMRAISSNDMKTPYKVMKTWKITGVENHRYQCVDKKSSKIYQSSVKPSGFSRVPEVKVDKDVMFRKSL